jgi:glycerol-3-phosphate dehydrogenase
VPVVPSPGVMVAVRGRHCNMVVNRLHPPGDGDIVLPQRMQTVLGTSSWLADDPDDLRVPADHVAAIVRESAALVPAVARAEIRAAWAAARPLIGGDGGAHGTGRGAGRGLPRELRCFDHARDAAPTEGFVTIAGGKASTLRAMAETTADVVCAKLGLVRPCETCEVVLLAHTAWYTA